MEWSFHIESEVLIELSLLWISLPGVNINDVPLLVELSVTLVCIDVLVLRIFVLINVHG